MKKLILIIEDDEIFRSIIFDLLELENFNVISAQDGFLGLKLAKQFNPDLILCDINIPHLNGYEVLNKLREDLTIAILLLFLSHLIQIRKAALRRCS
jgi:CheY-like chemotaxis protein